MCPCNTCFFMPTWVRWAQRMASWSVQPVLHSSSECRQASLPLQYCPFQWGNCTPDLIVVPHIHPTQYPKRHLYRFSCFCTAQLECLYTLQWAPSPLKIAPSHWGIKTGAHLIMVAWAESSTKTAFSISSAVFAELTTVIDRQTMLLGW